MKMSLSDRYIKGKVIFEATDKRAKLSYWDQGVPLLPVGALYTFDDIQWRVVAVNRSKFNSKVINVEMERYDS